MQKKRYRFNKGKLERFFTIVVALLFIVIASQIKFRAPEVDSYKTVIVRPGDTLWSIAEDTNEDIRRTIYDIKKENSIVEDEYLKPGQLIKVPVYKH